MHWSWLIIAALTLYYYYRYESGKKRDKGKQTPVTNTAHEPAIPAVDVQGPQTQPQHERVIGPEDFEDARFDPELNQLNHQANPNHVAAATVGTSRDRVVGTKKARSLERKDQRRAYFEHLRMQAQYDREEREEYDRQYADLQAEEHAAQAAANEAAAVARETALATSRQEARDAAAAARRVESAVVAGVGERGVLYLETDADREAAARVVQRSSYNGSSDSRLFIVGGPAEDWLVQFSEADMGKLAAEIQTHGHISFSELAQYLTDLKRQ
ncbi:hypothetical protein D0Z03_002735 [Geotrichum reessii]|nr:hypothetical protein D0Z03_002735 [Galactomyces reessii]